MKLAVIIQGGMVKEILTTLYKVEDIVVIDYDNKDEEGKPSIEDVPYFETLSRKGFDSYVKKLKNN